LTCVHGPQSHLPKNIKGSHQNISHARSITRAVNSTPAPISCPANARTSSARAGQRRRTRSVMKTPPRSHSERRPRSWPRESRSPSPRRCWQAPCQWEPATKRKVFSFTHADSLSPRIKTAKMRQPRAGASVSNPPSALRPQPHPRDSPRHVVEPLQHRGGAVRDSAQAERTTG
jgi:hypothetical protein